MKCKISAMGSRPTELLNVVLSGDLPMKQRSTDFPNSGSWDLKHTQSWGARWSAKHCGQRKQQDRQTPLVRWGHREERKQLSGWTGGPGLGAGGWGLGASGKAWGGGFLHHIKDGVSFCIQMWAAHLSKVRLGVVLQLGYREPQGLF